VQTVLAVKRVNELDYYTLGLHDLAKKLALSPNKALAVVKHLKLQDSEEYFKVVKVGKASSSATLQRHSIPRRRRWRR